MCVICFCKCQVITVIELIHYYIYAVKDWILHFVSPRALVFVSNAASVGLAYER